MNAFVFEEKNMSDTLSSRINPVASAMVGAFEGYNIVSNLPENALDILILLQEI